MSQLSTGRSAYFSGTASDNLNPQGYTIENLSQIYGKRTILDIVRLQIKPGETFALIGPSGAGKSTLLRLLAFLEQPTKGDVRLNMDGQIVRQPTITVEQRRRIAMVFQQPALLKRSVRQNIAYGLQLRGESDWGPRVDEILESLHLSKVANAPAATLSGGEKQRVAIARSLVLDPAVLILDEPTANLDPYNIRIIESLIQSRCQHTTIIMVTHNIFQAKRIADRVGLLLEGQMIETAPTEQFFNNPRDSRTAAFLNGDIVY